MEIRNLNPSLPMKENANDIGSVSTGTVGKREDLEVVSIPNVGASYEAPDNPTPTPGVEYRN